MSGKKIIYGLKEARDHAMGIPVLPESPQRWLCEECDRVVNDEDCLTAPNPFGASETVTGCPHCKSVDSLVGACFVDGCNLVATSGHSDAYGYRYVRTCWRHSPKNPKREDAK